MIVPISHHFDLYNYWLSKRNGRIVPARRDIDPAELGKLLPFLFIMDKAVGEFRFRLMGTGVVQDVGGDLTGKPLSAYAGNSPEAVAPSQAVLERILANAQPVFATHHYATRYRAIHNGSALLLPVSDDGSQVNMLIATRAACFNHDVRASKNWPEGTRMKLLDAIDIHQAPDLEKHCRDWKGLCLADGQR